MKYLKLNFLIIVVFPLFCVGQPVILTPNITDSITIMNLYQGLDYMLGNDSLEIDYKEAVKYLKKAADEGEFTSQFFLARIYEIGGYGIQQNIQKAFHWYEKSAENGLDEAMVYYGLLIMKNEGNPANYKKGVDLFRSAADQGNLKGMYCLGYMYLKGLGIEQDYSKAFPLFYSAASQQDIPSIHILGYCYEFGFGVEQSLENAIYSYKYSASKGYEQSIVRLAELNNPDLKSVTLSMKSLDKSFEDENLIPGKCSLTPEFINTNQDNLSGEWEGLIYTYDWSGNRVIDKQTVFMTLSKNQTYYEVSLDADYTHTFGEIYFDKTDAYFEHVVLKVKDSFDNYVDKSFNSMKVKVETNDNGTYLIGKVESFVEDHQEPGAPAMLILKLKSTATEKVFDQKFEDINFTVFPNPFNNTLNLKFNLPVSQLISINLYDLNGKLVKTFIDQQVLAPGEHFYTFNEELSQGIYLLDFCFDKEHHIQRIINN